VQTGCGFKRDWNGAKLWLAEHFIIGLIRVPFMERSPCILLVRLKSLGDVVFTLPAVHTLRTAFPQAHISYLVSKEYSALLEGFEDLDEIVTLDRNQFRRFNPFAVFSELTSVLRKLRQNRFSLAIDLQGYGETALLVRCSAAAERWGNTERLSRRWAYTRILPRNDDMHPIDANLDLLKHGGLQVGPVRNDFVLPRSASVAAGDFIKRHGLRLDRPTLFIQPFTSSPPKNWPLRNYLAFAEHWRNRGMQIVFGGGPSERLELEEARTSGFQVCAGAPILTSAGLMNLSTLIIGGDTGLLHLAVAMKKQVTMIMGSNARGSTHPYGRPDWTVLPESEKNLSTVSVDIVNEACFKALKEMGVI
jgi:ADP-heptose:LPS heptosyltransferase